MTLNELSEKTGININTLNKYRPGSTVSPSYENVMKLSNALKVEAAYFSTGLTSGNVEEMINSIGLSKEKKIEELKEILHDFSESDLSVIYSVIMALKEKY